MSHVTTILTMADDHECGICGASFDDHDELENHVEKEH